MLAYVVRVEFIPEILPVKIRRLDVRERPRAFMKVILDLRVGENAVVVLVALLEEFGRPLPHHRCGWFWLLGRLKLRQSNTQTTAQYSCTDHGVGRLGVGVGPPPASRWRPSGIRPTCCERLAPPSECDLETDSAPGPSGEPFVMACRTTANYMLCSNDRRGGHPHRPSRT